MGAHCQYGSLDASGLGEVVGSQSSIYGVTGLRIVGEHHAYDSHYAHQFFICGC